MSICCAFSFSLILLFWFWFSFPWAGVGEACAGVVNISIYIYFIFFFFLEGFFPEQLGFFSSCSSFLSRASPRSVCVSIAGDGRGPSQLLELWFRMLCFSLGLFLAPGLYLPKSSSVFPLVHAGHVLWSQRRRV